MTKIEPWFKSYRISFCAGAVLFVVLAVSWILYGWLGHRAIEAVYYSEPSGILSYFMKGRGFTPLENYYEAADRMMWQTIVRFVSLFLGSLILLFLVRTRLMGKVLVVLSSLIMGSLLLFTLFEIFPSWIRPLGIDSVGYYYYKSQFVPDDVLIHKNRPFRKINEIRSFRGDRYSSEYGLSVPPETYQSAATDEDGFINWMAKKSADIVVVGDSYIEFALHKGDDFGSRLERQTDLPVASLAIAGSGPIQYLEVLKRYGLARNPKYAVFSFFEGNDIWDINQYLEWQSGGEYWQNPSLSGPFYRRYFTAWRYIARFVMAKIDSSIQPTVKRRWFNHEFYPADAVAEVELGAKRYKMELIWYTYPPQSVDELLSSIEWQELRRVLKEFKELCAVDKIVPLLMNIPSKTRVYAKYSTERSGNDWLRIRDAQIVATENREKAILRLSEEIGLETLNLAPAFDMAAKTGNILFYPLGSHWNSKGREVAAAAVAERLKEKLHGRSEITSWN